MTWSVQFAPEARAQLVDLKQRIADAGAAIAGARYVDAIVDYCMKLQTFPERRVARDGRISGLRITHFCKRAIIAYTVDSATVFIVGVFYGGQDYESALDPNEN